VSIKCKEFAPKSTARELQNGKQKQVEEMAGSKRIHKGIFSSNSSEWATPKEFFNVLNAEFNFTLDPCATAKNAKCAKFFTKEENGLLQSWKGERVFCNPPYGKEISAWVKKCYKESQNGAEIVVMLIPARTDTRFFHEYIYQKHEVRFIAGRLHFNESKRSAPFPSMVVVMRKIPEEEITEGLK
jgi:site-specific DNA-methyltransferase (adenine-specific)